LIDRLSGMLDAIPHLKQKGIVVSAGHSMAGIDVAEKSVEKGVSVITHLFNAMIPVSSLAGWTGD
jgi:N-acetylglucosamine-6-phosphate deacetylase